MLSCWALRAFNFRHSHSYMMMARTCGRAHQAEQNILMFYLSKHVHRNACERTRGGVAAHCCTLVFCILFLYTYVLKIQYTMCVCIYAKYAFKFRPQPPPTFIKFKGAINVCVCVVCSIRVVFKIFVP